jgi:putative tryptophan/tyrosine transport system substrate-binding protein
MSPTPPVVREWGAHTMRLARNERRRRRVSRWPHTCGRAVAWAALMIALLTGLGCRDGQVSVPRATPAPTGIPRIGYVSVGAGDVMATARPTEEFRQGLRDQGYVEGDSIFIDYRYAERNASRLVELATALASVPVTVIVAADSQAAPAAKLATSTVPIVATSGDLIGQGLVESLARPGGNLTGVTNMSTELIAKRLELLREMVPGVSRAAVLSSTSAAATSQWEETRRVAAMIGLEIVSLRLDAPEEIASVVEAAGAGGVQALLVLADPFTLAHRQTIVEVAAGSRLPAIYGARDFVEAGGLVAYAPDRFAGYRRAAAFVDKILKGAKPADLPVEQPREFEFVFNLRTARALGLDVPRQTLLFQNAEVIPE